MKAVSVRSSLAVRGTTEGHRGTAGDAVEALRQRLAGSAARTHAVLAFLEEDLRASRAALAALGTYLDQVEQRLRADDLPAPALAELARSAEPALQGDALQEALVGLRRRLAQVAARM